MHTPVLYRSIPSAAMPAVVDSSQQSWYHARGNYRCVTRATSQCIYVLSSLLAANFPGSWTVVIVDSRHWTMPGYRLSQWWRLLEVDLPLSIACSFVSFMIFLAKFTRLDSSHHQTLAFRLFHPPRLLSQPEAAIFPTRIFRKQPSKDFVPYHRLFSPYN